jgi:hypothetical protein
MLLFFDQIQVIRPAEVDHPQYHEANQAIFELAPDAFAEIRKRHYEMSLVPQNKKMLSSLLDSIATKRRRYNDRRMILDVDDSGGLSIPGYPFFARLETQSMGAYRAKESFPDIDNSRIVTPARWHAGFPHC